MAPVKSLAKMGFGKCVSAIYEGKTIKVVSGMRHGSGKIAC